MRKESEQYELPLVSVLITTKNEEKNLPACLDSIKSQTYPQDRIEIIVVDNYSSDRTQEIARSYGARVFTKGPERSSQRNFGFEIAKGEWVLFLDADMRLSEKVIEECVRKVKSDSSIVGLYIPEVVIGRGFWIKVRRFERSFYNATVIDCVRFVNRKVFLEIGGFDESLTGPEDWDLDRRIRKVGKVDIINSPLFHDEGRFSFSKYLRKKSYYAGTVDNYIRKWGRKDPLVKKQLGFFYRYIGVFIENGKWRKIIKHPLLACSMIFLRFLVGLVFVLRKIHIGGKKKG